MSLDFLLDSVLTWVLLFQVVLILWNQHIMRRPQPYRWGENAPLVSVLIPARNEEEMVSTCLEKLLAQDYPNLEIIVLDDDSSDATYDIAAAVEDPRVRVVSGRALPPGWTGKNWACHQLSLLAAGDLLCWVDADTLLEPGAVSAAAGRLHEEKAGLVSLLPKSKPESVSAAVLLPMVSHALLGLFPAYLVHSSRFPSVSVAIGPFILMTRDAYKAAGGHAANPESIVDDVDLSRGVKMAGYSVRVANGTDLVRTRWYTSFGAIWQGFSKNAYGGIGYDLFFGLGIVFVGMPLLLTPFVRLGLGLWSGQVPAVVLRQVLLLLASRALTAHLGRDRQWATPFHALTIAFWGTTLAWSMTLSSTGRPVTWKGRETVTRPAD
jgi:chlorobactene glucosyltransferase